MEPQTVYVGYSGWRVTSISYSQASEMAECGKKFELKRIQGYAETKPSASFEFGKAMEIAVVAYLSAGADPAKKFEAEWQLRERMDLEYSKRDGDWKQLMGIGKALAAEFTKAHKSDFPWLDGSKCLFAKKILYSQTNGGGMWNGVDVEYIADLIDPVSGLMLDIKTAGASYPEPIKGEPNMIPWDNQLRIGAMLSKLRKVGFLVLVKTKTPKIQLLTGDVTEEMISDVQVWLKTQLQRIMAKEFSRDVGFKFPNQHCTWCEMAPACLGDAADAVKTGKLVLKQGKRMDVGKKMAALESL